MQYVALVASHFCFFVALRINFGQERICHCLSRVTLIMFLASKRFKKCCDMCLLERENAICIYCVGLNACINSAFG